jgi:hypothetical protein
VGTPGAHVAKCTETLLWAVGKIREIIAILKDGLRENPPLKKSKTADGQAAPTAARASTLPPRRSERRMIAVVKVYCSEVPLAACSRMYLVLNIRCSECTLETRAFYCSRHVRLVPLWSFPSSTTISYSACRYPSPPPSLCLGDHLSFWASLFSSNRCR